MTDLLLPDEIEIPDSIEPLILWKALLAKDGVLYSPSQEMRWPHKERAEAICSRSSWDYGWEPIKDGVPNIPTEEGTSYGPSFSTSSGSVVIYPGSYYGQGVSIEPMPRVELPEGMSWSWEAKPHQLLNENCGCGIYAVISAEACLSYCKGNSVICKIAVWGKVIRGEYGARAQYAYPQSIEFAKGLNNQELLRLAHLYGLRLPEGEVIYIPKEAEKLAESNNVFKVYTGPGPMTTPFPTGSSAWSPVKVTLNSVNDFAVTSDDEEVGSGLQAMAGTTLLLVYLLMGGIVVFGTPWFVKVIAGFCMLLMTVLLPWFADKNDA